MDFQDPPEGSEALACLRDGAVAHIVLNRPASRNAMTGAMWERLAPLARELDADDSVRVVVVRGAGTAAFCAGADILEFPQIYSDAQRTAGYNTLVREGQLALERLSKPTIALVRGACVGGGCGIALSCDLRFAANDARLGITPSRLGVAYSVPDTRRLTALVGPSRAKDILFSGRLMEATEAATMGLVDRVMPGGALDDAVAAYVRVLLANARGSMRTAKAMINSISGVHPQPDALLDGLFEQSFSSDDFREGFNAFAQKRPPRFR